jgi:hypothetical protein
MPIRRVGLTLAAAFTLAGGCSLLTACDQWALVINGDGLLLVTVVGDGNGQDRFRLRARQSDGSSRTMDVPASGNVTLGNLTGGQLELTLLAPEGCRVGSPNPRTLVVDADESVNVGFEVHCS